MDGTEESMLSSLFDSDTTSFLDELTEPGGGNGMGPPGMGGMHGMAEGGMMGGPQGIGHQGMGPGGMHHMQQQQPQGYGGPQYPPQMGGMQGGPMGGQQPGGKLHHYGADYGYDQFGQQQMGMGQQGMGMGQQGMMSPQHQQQNQFGSPTHQPSHGHMQTPPGGGYPQGYGMRGSPHMTPPRQAGPSASQMGMGMNTSPMWNQAGGPPGSQQSMQPMHNPPYMSQQSQQGGPGQGPFNAPGGGYMPHHPDYALPTSQSGPGMPPQNRLGHYADQPGGNGPQGGYSNPSPLGSPPPASRLAHMPMSSPGMSMNRPQHPMHGNSANYPNSSQGMMSQGNVPMNMGNFGPNGPGGFPDDPMQGGPQPGMNSAKMQHFGFGSQQSGQNNMPGQNPMVGQHGQGMGDAPPLSHYPQSPTHNPQFRQGYSNMNQKGPTPSPRPTPPPPSHTPTGHMPHPPSTQGNFGQSSLQQLEQLVPPAVTGVSSSPPFSSSGPQTAYTVASTGPQVTMSTSQNFGGPNGPNNFPPGGPIVNTNLGVNNQAGGPMSPSVQMGPAAASQHNAMNMEIQQLQQQIQQLYQMQQTPQTQQKMLDLQERMRSLKANQQLLQQQQQRQHAQMQQQQHKMMQQQQQMHPGGPQMHPQQQQMRMRMPQHPMQRMPQSPNMMANQQQQQLPSQNQQPGMSGKPQQAPGPPRQQALTPDPTKQQQSPAPSTALQQPAKQEQPDASPQVPTSQPATPSTPQQMGPGPPQMSSTSQPNLPTSMAGPQTSMSQASGPQLPGVTTSMAGGMTSGAPPVSGAPQMQGGQQSMSGVPQMPGSMQGGPQGMQGGPQGMQRGSQGMQSGPQGMEGGPHGMQGGPPGMQGGPPGMQGPPNSMQGMPPSMQGMRASMSGGPHTMQGMPPSMQGGPGHPRMQGPRAMHPGPMGMPGDMPGQQQSMMPHPSQHPQHPHLHPQQHPHAQQHPHMQQQQMLGQQQQQLPPGMMSSQQGLQPPAPHMEGLLPSPVNDMNEGVKPGGKSNQSQEKANRIIAEAVAKAQAEGKPVPRIVTPPPGQEAPTEEGKGKKKRERKPRVKKTKEEREKERQEKKEAKEREKKEKKEREKAEREKARAEKKQKTPTKPKIRPVKKKKLPPATFIKSLKRKRKNSEDDDLELTPPPSPKEEDSLIQKRRSARHTKRKKYLDDIDLQLSDEEHRDAEGNVVQEGVATIKAQDNQEQEDTLIVEKVLGMRMGKRPKPKEMEVQPEPAPEPDSLPEPEKVAKTDGEEDVDIMGDQKKDDEDTEVEEDSQSKPENMDESTKEEDKMEVDTDSATEETKTEEKDEESKMKKEPETEGPKPEVAPAPVTTEAKRDTVTENSTDKPAENSTEKQMENSIASPTKMDTSISPKKEGEIKKAEEEEVEMEDVEEFYVKYKNFSYLHCEWRTLEELELGDKRAHQKIKRYRMKRLAMNSYFLELEEDEMFNPDYVEVDRVLAISTITDPVSLQPVTHYLVKWRGLPYEDSTWEIESDVDKQKIEAYEKFKELPPEEDREYKGRPRASEWKKLEESPVYKNDNVLREYQLEGISWLTFCWYNKQNCILADEMGLGKTIQSITFLQEVVNYGIKGPFLIIVPLSTIGNWQREFETWTDINTIVYHGSSPSRNMLQEYEMFYKDENGARVPEVYKFQALITTYEIIISDVELLSQIDWRVCIIDEAHRLKNKNCKLMEGLKYLDIEHRVLLTGTPLQNNVEELFSLLNFLEPKQFNSQESFMGEFGNLKSEEQVDKLKAVLKPMMLRRLKEDVEKNLAPKEETIVEVELTNIQKKYYRAILERNFSFLAKGATSNANVPNLMNTVMELRKCCNHPFLVTGAEEKIMEDARAQTLQPDPDRVLHAMIQSSGKLVLVDKLLPKLKAGNHKVLIFSQMIRVLDILEDYLIQKKYLYERLDGRIRGNIRQEAIDRFSRPDSDRFVFLLCTRAGGLGINLTAADTVIIYDSDWNPQNDLQAQARCHRIGQRKSVKVYRLITRNSYEREMFDRASLKLGLDKAVLQSTKQEGNAGVGQLSKKEVEDLLRRGAYGAVMDDDNAGEKFCEEDIDLILQRRTQVIQIESEGKGSTFAKASFSVSSNRTDIDIDDPEFWQKWARKADIDMDEINNKNNLIIEQPRARKQTARYGNQDSILDMSELESSDSDEEGEGELERGLTGRGRGRGRGGRSGKSGRQTRRPRGEEDYDMCMDDEPVDGNFLRSECFKVEKNLLVYGWGRWEDIYLHAHFKRKLTEDDVITISRALLSYSLMHYKGDEHIKSFIWDLITPTEDGQEKDHSNHLGLSAPVPRGRKGRKMKEGKGKESGDSEMEVMNKMNMDPNTVLQDEGYKKHLQRHSNKVLLRVRLLYYLKQEVIGDQADRVFEQYPYTDIDLPPSCPEGEPPAPWWDEDADKCLLIGIFKHGYEKFNAIRQDPCLLFLSRCGPPDVKALKAEQDDDDIDNMDDGKDNDDDMDSDFSAKRSLSSTPVPTIPVMGESGFMPFPSHSDLNTRLRRIITSYQRNHKRNFMKHQQKTKRENRRERFEIQIKEREIKKREQQQRWSRREETDFYRVVSTFGVERDFRSKEFKWNTFRSLARLDKKYDETLTEYFKAFYYMCKRVCKKFLNEEEMKPPNSLWVEPISEERASRCLARIDLLNKIREEMLWHPKLDERLKLCQPSPDMPEWWECGTHDKELLIGAAKHGLARTDYHILHDPKLVFKDVLKARANMKNIPPSLAAMSDASQSESVIKSEVKTEIETPGEGVKEEKNKEETETKPIIKSSPAKEEDGENKLNDVPNPAEKKEEGEEEKKSQEVKSVKEEQESKPEIKSEKSPVKSEEKETKDVIMEVKEDVEVKKEKEEAKGEIKEEKNLAETGEGNGEVKKELMGGLKRLEELKNAIQNKDESTDSEMDTDDVDGKGPETPQFLKKKPLVITNTNLESCGDNASLQDFDGEPSMAELIARSMNNPSIQWPKDRVIFHRLEHVCHCVEKGEWPFLRRFPTLGRSDMSDSRSSTPIPGTPTPKSDTPLGQDYSLMGTPERAEFKGDGLKLTFHKKRGRPRKIDMDGNAAESSDVDSESNLSGIHGNDSLLNGNSSEALDYSPLPLGDHSSPMPMEFEMPMKKKRGRKRKIDKLMEEARAAAAAAAAAAEATARRDSKWSPAAIDPDSHIPVISLEDGSRLSGDEAPRARDLDSWLDKHPGYMVDRPDAEDVELNDPYGLGRRKRRPRIDPTKLDMNNLTGDENVSVVNRETGKKITGAKAPPLRFLAQWLEKNPAFDIDPKWGPLVKAKGNLPEKLQSRVPTPSNRGRRPGSSSIPSLGAYTYPSVSSMNAFSNLASSGMMSFPKMPLGMPFGSIPGLGLANMYGMANFGMMAGLAASASNSGGEEKEPGEKEKKSSPGKSSSSGSNPTTPHPSFPSFMYNPMMFNPLFAQSLAGNFSLPTGLPTSFASLAQARSQMMNGGLTGESDEEGDASKVLEKDNDSRAQDLSVKKSSSSQRTPQKRGHDLSTKSQKSPEDLSVKKHKPEDLSAKYRPQDLTKKRVVDIPKKKPEDLSTKKRSLESAVSELKKDLHSGQKQADKKSPVASSSSSKSLVSPLRSEPKDLGSKLGGLFKGGGLLEKKIAQLMEKKLSPEKKAQQSGEKKNPPSPRVADSSKSDDNKVTKNSRPASPAVATPTVKTSKPGSPKSTKVEGKKEGEKPKELAKSLQDTEKDSGEAKS